MADAAEAVLLAVTVACLVSNLFVVCAKVARAGFVLDNVVEVGLKPTHVPLLAILEGAGVIGLAIGLLGAHLIGLAASIGLLLFFAIAVAAHVRAQVLHSIGFPLMFLALAVGSTVHFAIGL